MFLTAATDSSVSRPGFECFLGIYTSKDKN